MAVITAVPAPPSYQRPGSEIEAVTVRPVELGRADVSCLQHGGAGDGSTVAEETVEDRRARFERDALAVRRPAVRRGHADDPQPR